MKVLIIGNGGREHALAWKIAQSPQVDKIYVAPGNAGTALEDKVTNMNIMASDIDSLLAFALQQSIDLTIVGPEAPLVQGIVNYFQQHDLAIFGPTQAAAQLEGSKEFTKDFLSRHHIPTAQYQSFSQLEDAIAYIQQQGTPIVIKADGLAAGKGVILAMTEQQAIASVTDMLSGNVFGEAGHRVVIEEFLIGEEASFIVMVDGEHVLPLATSQDHKARDNGDKGPNTGGMGAYSPAPVIDAALHDKIMQDVILPTIKGMAEEGNPYHGFLYAGLMISPEGKLHVLEYNCRFGDPETQPILMRLQSDLVELCQYAIKGKLDQISAKWSEQSAVGVVMAANGYPGNYPKNEPIKHLDTINQPECKVFHAGTRYDEEQQTIVSNGGRVLCVVALGDDVATAQQKAYQAIQHIDWPNAYYRTDIAYRAIDREKS